MPIRDYSFVRYLEAKKTVDDRALNRVVWERLAQALNEGESRAVRAVEVGGGIGTMLARMIEGGLLRQVEYVLVDLEAGNVEHAKTYLAKWAASQRLNFVAGERDEARIVGPEVDVQVIFKQADLLEIRGLKADLVIAHAVLDLLDLKQGVAAVMGLAREGGLCYATINYDGLTLFEPEIDSVLDAEIRRLYNLTMDERMTDGRPSGDSLTGRHLFTAFKEAGAQVLAAGSSDWVVHPDDGAYPADEAAFLHFIIHTVDEALKTRPELARRGFGDWVAERHRQIDVGELVYIAHQLDFLSRKASGL